MAKKSNYEFQQDLREYRKRQILYCRALKAAKTLKETEDVIEHLAMNQEYWRQQEIAEIQRYNRQTLGGCRVC